jgi:hypothetical protein
MSGLKWEGDIVSGAFIMFKRSGMSKSGRTQLWGIYASEDDQFLGGVSWYGPWRQYVFHPAGATIFEKVCLGDIAQFLKDLADLRKEQKNRERESKLLTSAKGQV